MADISTVKVGGTVYNIKDTTARTNATSNSAHKHTKDQIVAALGYTPAQVSDVTLSNISGTLAVSKGGTGATTAASARTNLGIGSASIGSASGWSAGSNPSLTITTVACDDITSWNAGTAAKVPTFTVSALTSGIYNGTNKLVLTAGSNGTAPSLSYTARSVGSASNWSAGSAPSLTITNKTVATV